MASASSAIPTCVPAPWCASATSATTAPPRAAVSYAAVPASPTPTTARSARSRRRTGTVALRLSTSAVLRPTSSTSARSMASSRDRNREESPHRIA